MIYLKQKLFSAVRQNVRENCNLFIFLEQRGRAPTAIYEDVFNRTELSYDDISNIYEKAWEEPLNYIVIDKCKNRNINGKLRINSDLRIL